LSRNEGLIKDHLDKIVVDDRGRDPESYWTPKPITCAGRSATSTRRPGWTLVPANYERQLHTKAGEVTLKVPKLRSLPFESAIIERYKRREISVEEALVEMYLAGVSVRRVEDITQALWGTRVSPSTVSAPRRATARGPRRHTATGARTTMISSVRAGRQHRLHDHRGSHGYGRFPSLRAGDTLPKPVDRRRYRNLHNIISSMRGHNSCKHENAGFLTARY